MLIGVASKSRTTRSGAAPALQARWRASARARRIRSIPASPTESNTRLAVEIDAISPNSAGCPASTARSETHRPPLRVGSYRIIYQLSSNDRTLRVATIRHRSVAYDSDPR
jgi:mRNA-degrading endonuclease RelE of RelBE toxin-antitoxin system